MPARIVPLSVRLSKQEADFINELEIDDAETPSEKLRAIIGAAQQRKVGTTDYSSALRLAQDSLLPTLDIVKTSEHEHEMHSEVVARVGNWVADCMAFLTACNGEQTQLSEAALQQIEKKLIDRVALLMQSVLQLGITHNGPFYDAGYFTRAMQPVIELATIVGMQKSS